MKKIELALLALDKRPLFGNAPPFPWEQLSLKLQQSLGVGGLILKAGVPEWQDSVEMKGAILLHCPPIEGSFGWKMAKEDLTRLMSWVLGGDPYAAAFGDTELAAGFHQFLVQHIARELESVDYPACRLAEESPKMEGPFLVVDVEMAAKNEKAFGQIVLPSAFHQAWIAHFASMPRTLSPETKENLRVDVHIETGRTAITHNEWRSVKKGDFIALDSYHEGSCQLTIAGNPLFRGQLTESGVQLEGHNE